MRRLPRKLTVLASFDAAGYTRRVQDDERGTLAEVADITREILLPTLSACGGNLFKTMGDGGLIEFPNVEDSVRWGIDFQTTMYAREREHGGGLRVRLAIALADVFVTGDDRYGAAVAFVVRLQAATPPGALVITHSVRWQLLGSLAEKFFKMEPMTLKDVDYPIEAWCWTPEGLAPPRPRMMETVPATAFQGAAPAEPPSIAVLAFDNLSGDPEAETIADGIVEELTATLSRIRDFTVIARNSAYVYKGRAHDVREVGRALGVRYVVEGSVRKVGNQLRVTAQLIDAITGSHVWADGYRGAVDDVFALEDRIVEAVAGALRPSIRAAEIEQAKRKRPESRAAYDLVLTALPHLWGLRRDDNDEAIRLLDQAVALDPGYPRAAAFAAWARAQEVVFTWTADVDKARSEGERLIALASEASGDDPTALTALGTAVMLLLADMDRAEILVDRALGLDPNHAWAWSRRGFIKVYRGDPAAATECFERAIKLSPLDPFSFNAHLGLGFASFAAGDAAEAVRWTELAMREKPGLTWAERDLAAFLAAAGRAEEAKAAIRRLLAAHPHMTIPLVADALRFTGPDLLARYLDALHQAGLPE